METIQVQHYSNHQFDRIGLTIFFALAFHAIIILGVSFDLENLLNADTASTMEITLVHSHSRETPEEADYLAQANQIGGGNLEEKVRPTSPFSNPFPTPEDGIAPHSQKDLSPPPLEKSQQQKEVMTANQAREKVDSRTHQDEIPTNTKSPTAAQLFEKSRQIARLRAEINESKRALTQSRHTFVSGINAKEYRFASYIESWRSKVERFGNINYPEAAIKNKINAKITLDVAINPDGGLHDIRIIRSSGHTDLDNAALKIAKLSAPFAPLTPEILKDTDIFHIVLDWNFRVKYGFKTTVN